MAFQTNDALKSYLQHLSIPPHPPFYFETMRCLPTYAIVFKSLSNSSRQSHDFTPMKDQETSPGEIQDDSRWFYCHMRNNYRAVAGNESVLLGTRKPSIKGNESNFDCAFWVKQSQNLYIYLYIYIYIYILVLFIICFIVLVLFYVSRIQLDRFLYIIFHLNIFYLNIFCIF